MRILPAVFLMFGFSMLVTICLAIPCWLLWTVAGIGVRYFGFLPLDWQVIPLVQMMGLFLIASMIRGVIIGSDIKLGSHA